MHDFTELPEFWASSRSLLFPAKGLALTGSSARQQTMGEHSQPDSARPLSHPGPGALRGQII